jgi:hypothetical protein
VAATEVLCGGNRLQVLGSHAGRDAAQVVEGQARRDRSDSEHVGEPVGLHGAVNAGGERATEVAVVPGVALPEPQPAALSGTAVDLRLEPVGLGPLRPEPAGVSAARTMRPVEAPSIIFRLFHTSFGRFAPPVVPASGWPHVDAVERALGPLVVAGHSASPFVPGRLRSQRTSASGS